MLPALVLSASALMLSAAALAPDPAAATKEVAERWFDALLVAHPFHATEIGDPRFDDRMDLSIDEGVRELFREATAAARAELAGIDPDVLAFEDRLTYDFLVWQLELTLEGLAFPDHLLPVDFMMSSPPFFLAHMASENGTQPLETIEDFERFLKRLRGFSTWVEVAIANMQKGMARGVVLPCPVTERTVGRLEGFLAMPVAENPLYRCLDRIPKTVPREESKRLRSRYRDALRDEVLPSYRKLNDFLRTRYEPRCREQISWSALPEGSAWYRHRVRASTTTRVEPEQLFELGQREAARVVSELGELAAKLGFEDVVELFERVQRDRSLYLQRPQAVEREFEQLHRRVRDALPRLFLRSPRTPLEIRLVTPEQSSYTSGNLYLAPRSDGSRPGVFYVEARGLYPKFRMESLFLHEALPGHHFQISLAFESEQLPRFRRFAFPTAYVEGWALYAEGLGEDLGLYRDPYQHVGRLSMQLLRSARLLLDTGIHEGGWSADRATEVALRRTLGSGQEEIDRYSTMPGQALAYKVGEQCLLNLREEAEEALGPRFDPRAFHHEVLRHGPLPLELLERVVRRWIAQEAPEPGVGRSDAGSDHLPG